MKRVIIALLIAVFVAAMEPASQVTMKIAVIARKTAGLVLLPTLFVEIIYVAETKGAVVVQTTAAVAPRPLIVATGNAVVMSATAAFCRNQG